MRNFIVISMLAVGCGGEPFAPGFNSSPGLEADGGSDAAGGASTTETDAGGSGAGGRVDHPHGGELGTGGSGGTSTGGTNTGTGGAPDATGGALSATGGAPSTGGAGSGGAPQEKDGGCALVTHDNGLGQTWQDCVPLGTYDLAQAMAACNASGAARCVDAQGCGAGTSVVIGYDAAATVHIVAAWGYAGYTKSFVGQSASCPGSGPTWN